MPDPSDGNDVDDFTDDEDAPGDAAAPPPFRVAPGVWEVDAPEGSVALAVFGVSGARLARLEILAALYTPAILAALEEWRLTQDLRLVP